VDGARRVRRKGRRTQQRTAKRLRIHAERTFSRGLTRLRLAHGPWDTGGAQWRRGAACCRTRSTGAGQEAASVEALSAGRFDTGSPAGCCGASRAPTQFPSSPKPMP
jgi:hypothetical protein